MSVVHLHLLLNHVPVIGTFFVAAPEREDHRGL
jgi:hypothetical protein